MRVRSRDKPGGRGGRRSTAERGRVVPAEREGAPRGGARRRARSARPSARPRRRRKRRKRLRELHFMKCPKCGHDMKEEELEASPSTAARFCEGIFFDAGELEQRLPQAGRGAAQLLPQARQDLGARERRAVPDRRQQPPRLLGRARAARTTAAREVVRRVAAFCRARGAKATLVFDGHPLRPRHGQRRTSGPLRLRVPPQGRTPTR